MTAPTNVKLDFNQFVRAMMDEHGEDNCDLDSVNKITMVTFRRMENGNIAGFWRGNTVYRDRESEAVISAGETWFCELKSNPNNSHQYFARAIEKVGAGFLYDLRKDQLDELAKVIWNDQRSTIEPELEVFYKDRIESRSKEIAESMIAEIRSERDAMRDDIAMMIAEKGEMMERINTMEEESSSMGEIIDEFNLMVDDKDAQIELLNERIESLLCELDAVKIRYNMTVCELEKERCRTVQPNIRSTSDAVIRIDSNTLYSSRFQDGRYKVRFSSDRKRMRIESDVDGETVCSNNQLRIDGLWRMSPFTTAGEVAFEEKDGVLEARLC